MAIKIEASITLQPSVANCQVTRFTVQQSWFLLVISVSPGLGFIQVSLFLQLGTVDDDSLEEYYSKSVSLNKQQCQVLLRLTLRRTGCFRARISYKDQPLSNGEFDVIVLNGEQPSRAEEKQCSRRHLAQECSNLLKTNRLIFPPGVCVFSCVTLLIAFLRE